jgi:hypothetical protein
MNQISGDGRFFMAKMRKDAGGKENARTGFEVKPPHALAVIDCP